jgi:nucleoside phosphorylase
LQKANHQFTTFIYSALLCEAKPLIDGFWLKKDTNIDCLSVYSNNSICLTVTGVGKTSMAAGVAYTQALFPPIKNPIMLNIGIAGHKDHPIGNLFLVDKISDCDTDRRYYPPLVFTPPCSTYSLQTSARPQLTYPEGNLCDMEASAFYETAVRFSTGELIQCLKIVSDNQSSSINAVNPAQVSSLIADQISHIETILVTLTKLAEIFNTPESNQLDQILTQYRFTANEQLQLRKLLSRWELVKGENALVKTTKLAKNGKEFLNYLNQELNEAEFYL